MSAAVMFNGGIRLIFQLAICVQCTFRRFATISRTRACSYGAHGSLHTRRPGILVYVCVWPPLTAIHSTTAVTSRLLRIHFVHRRLTHKFSIVSNYQSGYAPINASLHFVGQRSQSQLNSHNQCICVCEQEHGSYHHDAWCGIALSIYTYT